MNYDIRIRDGFMKKDKDIVNIEEWVEIACYSSLLIISLFKRRRP